MRPYELAAKKIIVDKAAWPGASGSPLYTSDGRVIGVLIEGGINKGAGLALARPTDSALDMLSDEKIPIEK